ncbi:MAG: sensor histidine kinase, partial [Flammeovirgaceae bacterium]
LHCPEPLPELTEDTTIILFRMAQEMLNNAVKHSGADRIKILMTKINDLLTLEIIDNGKGFNFSEKIKSGGSGLLNLQSRAKLIHATVSVQSSEGNGTRISIELPLIQQDAFTNNATA